MNRPIVSTKRAILFRRTYNDDSGMPHYPRGSTRCEVIPFDSETQKLLLVQQIIDRPDALEPYLIGPVKVVGVRPNGNLNSGSYKAVEFVMSTKLTDELRDTDVPRYANHIDPSDRAADHDHEVSMTFNVSDQVAKLELARWIEAKLLHAFVHTDATIYYTAITNVTERPRVSPPYHASYAMAVAARAQHAPADNEGDNESDNESEDSGIPVPDDDSEDVSDDELPPVALPQPGSDTDAQMLRRVSDEMFAVRQEMPEQIYIRLCNALKRHRDG